MVQYKLMYSTFGQPKETMNARTQVVGAICSPVGEVQYKSSGSPELLANKMAHN